MSNNDQVSRRVHDRTGGPASFKTKRGRPSSSPGSTEGSQNRTGGPVGPAQQRFWYSCSANYGLEATCTRWNAHFIRVANGEAKLHFRTERTTRRASISVDWSVKTGPPERSKTTGSKKIASQLGPERNHLIEPAHPQLSINQQWALLSIPRSSYYYRPVGESANNLALMLRIDRLFTDRPEMGLKRMHQELTTESEPLNVKRIRRLMRLMGLEAVGPKPNLSKLQRGHTTYPYLLRGVSIERVNQVWSTAAADRRHHVCADGKWFPVFMCRDRLVQPLHFELAVEQYIAG